MTPTSTPNVMTLSDAVAHSLNLALLIATAGMVFANGLPDGPYLLAVFLMVMAPVVSSVQIHRRAREGGLPSRTGDLDAHAVLEVDARLEALERARDGGTWATLAEPEREGIPNSGERTGAPRQRA